MHMLHRRRRLAARFFAISLLAATLFTVDSLASPSPAEARCIGVGNPVFSWFAPFGDGVTRVSETAGFDTCNNNNIYTGILKDQSADGYCVTVSTANGNPPVTWFEEATVCGAGKTTTFSFEDSNNNHQVWEQLCIVTSSLPSTEVACGWGQVVNGYAMNSGF